MKKLFKVMSLLMVFVSLFTLASCGGNDDATVKIGSSGPLSGSVSIYGQAVKKGVAAKPEVKSF